MQAHGGGHGPFDRAAAPLPGVFPAVPIGRLVPEKRNQHSDGTAWHPTNGEGDTDHVPSTSQGLFCLILHLAVDKYYIVMTPTF